MASDCATCLGLDAACHECGGDPDHRDAFAGAERWFAKEGDCAGCGRHVKNGVSRGRGVACVACWWRAIGGAP